MKHIIITLTAAFLTASLSNAQTATPVIHQTQSVQEKKINQGIKSGEVTRHEATKLNAEQAKINHDKKDAKADGVVTHHEKKAIKREQQHAAKHIHNQKHDAQATPAVK